MRTNIIQGIRNQIIDSIINIEAGSGSIIDVDFDLSTLDANPTSITANGITTTDVEWNPVDSNGDPVAVIADDITADIGFIDIVASLLEPSAEVFLANGSASVNIIATLKDTDNNPVVGRTVTLTKVAGPGTLTQPASATNGFGIAIGSIVSSVGGPIIISASCDGVTLLQQVIIYANAGSRPNEPVGYTQITNYNLTTLDSENWDEGSATWPDLQANVLTDVTSAPVSPNDVFRAVYPVGFPGGTAPPNSSIFRPFSAPEQKTSIYYSMVLRASENFQGHSSATNKMNFVWLGGNPRTFISLEGSDLGTLQCQLRLQNVPDARARLIPNQGPSGNIVRGGWHNIEVQMICNTGGLANGTARVWLDGTLIAEYTDVNFATSNLPWESFYIQPIWGGTGDVVDEEMYVYFDNIYVSAV